MECEFCKKILKDKYILKNHQKRAKYCLDKQKEIGSTAIKPDLYTCVYCNKKMGSNIKNRHLGTCKVKAQQEQDEAQQAQAIEHAKVKKELTKAQQELIIKDNKITVLEEQLKIYKELSEKELETISDIARQPKSTTNNTQNNTNNYNLVPLDMDDKEGIARIVEESFTDQYVFDGQKGIARFARDFYLKDKDGNVKYICTDPSRHTFRYKNIDGNMERDIKARKLTSAIANDVIKKSCDFVKNMDSELFVVCLDSANCITNLSKDNTQFCNELAVLTSVNK